MGYVGKSVLCREKCVMSGKVCCVEKSVLWREKCGLSDYVPTHLLKNQIN